MMIHVKAVTTYVRRPMQREDHPYLRTDYGNEAYRAERRKRLEAWEARRDAMVAMNHHTVADDMRLLPNPKGGDDEG